MKDGNRREWLQWRSQRAVAAVASQEDWTAKNIIVESGNYSLFRHSKGANLCLKCTKIHLAAGLRPDPLGEI